MSKNRGFSLIEVVIVMAIIAVLSTIAIPNISKYMYKANKTKIINATSVLNTLYIEYVFLEPNSSLEDFLNKEDTKKLEKSLKLDELNSDGSFKVSNITGRFFVNEYIIDYEIDGEKK